MPKGVYDRSKARPPVRRKAKAAEAFASLCAKASPEAVLHAVLLGATHIEVDGEEIELTDQMIDAAKALVPYRLPRLNSIDAVNRNVEMTHEQWIEMLEQEGDA